MKRKLGWLVVSCLVVAALLMASCGGAEEEEVVAKEIPFPPMPVDIGQRVANELLAVTLTEVKIVASYDCYSAGLGKNVHEEAGLGKLFLMAYFIVENVQNRSYLTGYRETRLYDAEGNTYYPGQYLGKDFLLGANQLPVGGTMRGWVVFSFPEKATNLTLKYNTAMVTFPPHPREIEWEFKVSEWNQK